MGRLIVLTGLDGSGKDFVAEHLHGQDPGSTLMHTPTAPFEGGRSALDALAKTQPAVHYLYYLASVIHASSLIQPMLQSGNVYCVRYLIDTIVYHRALGLDVRLEYTTPFYSIRPPDCTVLLAVSDEDLRLARIGARAVISAGDELVKDPSLAARIMHEYAACGETIIRVENAHRDVSDVVDEIRRVTGLDRSVDSGAILNDVR